MRVLMLVMWLVLAAGASETGWREVKNLEVNEDKLAGWVCEVPSDWQRMAGVQPAPPLGEGFQDPSGKALCTVTWVQDKATKEDEQVLLPQRGYTLRQVRVAGRTANEYFKERPDGGTERVVYIFSPQGGCRVFLVSKSPAFEDTFRKILTSFRIMAATGMTDKPWKAYHDKSRGYSLKMPPLWDAIDTGQAITLGQSGLAPAVTLRIVEKPADQSLRGFARTAGKDEVPGGTLDSFEPFSTESGLNGYLALWTVPGGKPVLLAYLPLGASALQARLNANQHLELFNRVLRSVKL